MNSRSVINPPHSTLPGPEDITRSVLPNGIVALARANFNSPSVVIHGYLPAGSLFDSDDKLGMADFVAPALMRGTQQRNFQQLYDALESVGASLGFGGGTHTISFSGKALCEDLPLLFQLLGETLRQPVFPEDQVERLRAQLLTSLAIRAQDTGEVASMAFDNIVYAGHPYARPEDGYPETVQTITRDDLAAFHQRHYGPKGMVVSLVGAVEPERAIELLHAALGDWQNDAQPEPPALPPVTPLTNTVTRRASLPGKSQADMLIGAFGPHRNAPEYVAASLGNSVLGQFGMMGRIGDVVREQNGLAYYAYSSLGGGIGPGPWYVAAGVNPANVDKAIELIRAEIVRLISEPVSAEELADCQANYIGRLPLSLETNAGVAGALITLERFDLGLDYYRRYPAIIQNVTREEALAAAQKYLHPDRLAISVAGP